VGKPPAQNNTSSGSHTWPSEPSGPIQRSSAHPVEYAIMLLVERDGEWHMVRMFDNAHDPTEHHEHRYIGSAKQEPIITHGSVNDAMHAAEVKIKGGWSDIVRSWENT
jgi:hypothetical protein